MNSTQRLRALFLVAAIFSTNVANAALRVHALTIGNNRPPAPSGDSDEPPLAALSYADDDAAAFHELISAVAPGSQLLTIMDPETQGLYPQFVGVARVPTASEVGASVAVLRREIELDHRNGDRSAIFIFYSGHGSLARSSTAALAMVDFDLDREFLYSQVLEQLPADYIHLLVDACHAEAVVRPRDTEAGTLSVSSTEASALLVRSTLARFPHVGAIVAAATDAEAHEWSAIRHGIFTYELLSALRGAADVNKDEKVEYSEVVAFLSAANRSVRDPRGRLSVVARPPDIDRRVALLNLADLRAKFFRLAQVPAEAGLVEVTDESGRKHATLRIESGQSVDLLLPAERRLFINVGSAEAAFTARSGETLAFSSLRFLRTKLRARGAIESSVRNGLFASAFGRGYYSGFVDQSPDFVAVPFTPSHDTVRAIQVSEASASGVPRTVEIGGGLSSVASEALGLTAGLRLGTGPLAGAGAIFSLDVMRATAFAVDEWRYRASGGFIWPLNHGAIRSWVGGAMTGGVFVQTADGFDARASGVLGAGPVARLTADVNRSVGFLLHAELLGLGYRQDDRTVVTLAPAAFVGSRLAF